MSYQDIVLEDTPVVLLPLDEASGATATDQSGNGNNGTYTGAVTYGQTGPWPSHTAVKFTANGQYVSTSAAFAYAGGKTTIGCWLKSNTKPASDHATICSLANSESATLFSPVLSVNDQGQVRLHVFDAGTSSGVDVTGSVDVCDGEWHYIVGSIRSHGLVKLYVDGAVDGTPLAIVSLWGATPLKLFVGAGSADTYELGDIDGTVAWAELYANALSATRIMAHYTATEPPTPYTPDPAFPTIAGTPSVGHVLRCQPGSWWTDGGATISYQWRRGGLDIAGATSAEYTLQAADDGNVIDCNVTATGTPTESQASDYLTCQASATVAWDPTVRQMWEPDTLLLFDPDQEIAFRDDPVYGFQDKAGQFTALADCFAWRVGGPVTIIDGKYRHGVEMSSDPGMIWLPGTILPTDEFTAEFFVKSAAAWSDQDPVDIVSFAGTDAGHDSARLCVACKPDADGLRLTCSGADFDWNIVASALDAAAWINVAVTFDGATIRLLIDGDEVGSHAVTAPFAWSATHGLSILSNGGGTGAGSNWQLSDLRVSRQCRAPAVPVDVTAASTVTFASATSELAEPHLLGGVSHFPNDDPGYGALAAEIGVSVGRHTKLESALPIVAGGADSDHPVEGESGLFSYNMGPVDHLCEYLASLGMALYLNFGSCPEILGGSVSPVSFADCADPTWIGGDYTGWAREVPSDTDQYVAICTDIYQYIRATYPTVPISHVSYANEPDVGPGDFWAGTNTELFDIYAALAAAIKAIDPDQLVGGIEIGDWVYSHTGWSGPFMSYVGANATPLDFVSFHDYSGDLNYPAMQAARILADAAAEGVPAPAIFSTERNWVGAYLPGQSYPFKNYHMSINDWAGAWTVAQLLAYRHAGITAAFHFVLVSSHDTDAYPDALGIFDRDAVRPWAVANGLQAAAMLLAPR